MSSGGTARSLDEAKTRFFNSASHELRTPLQVILGHLEILESVDGLPPGEGAFLLCSFYLADNYSVLGRGAEARARAQAFDAPAAGPADPVGKEEARRPGLLQYRLLSLTSPGYEVEVARPRWAECSPPYWWMPGRVGSLNAINAVKRCRHRSKMVRA